MIRLHRACVLAVPFLLLSQFGCSHPGEVPARGAAVAESAGPAPEVGGLSGPHAHGELQIWLVHGPDQHRPGRPLLPLAEALAQGVAVVHETGDVNELAIENVGKDANVFVQSGDIVQGGKQDRTIGVDLVLAPRSGRVPLPSFCVEHGRWSARGGVTAGGRMAQQFETFQQIGQVAQVDSQGAAPAGSSAARSSGFFLSSSNSVATKEMKRAVLVDADQQRVWSRVADTQASLAANLGVPVQDAGSPSSLELTLESKAVKEAIASKVAALQGVVDGKPDTIGCVVVIGGRLDHADVYGSHALFVALWPKLLRAAATAAVADGKPQAGGEDGAGAARGEPTLEQVRGFLGVVQGEPRRRATAGGVQMAVGETALNHVVDSTVEGRLLHRTYLAK